MSGLIGKAMKLAKTKQGKQALDKVQKYTSSPEGKQRIEDLKEKVSGKKEGPPAAKPDPHQPTSPSPGPATGPGGTSEGTSSAGA